MEKKKKNLITEYVVALLINLGIMVAFAFWKKMFTEMPTVHLYRNLSDMFFTLTVINGGVGILVWATNEGSFDAIAYGLRSFFSMFSPYGPKTKYGSYYEYKQVKGHQRYPFGFLLVYGALFLILSLIMYGQYLKLS